MEIDKYFEDGLLFEVWYRTSSTIEMTRIFMFSIDETEQSVEKILSSDPYNMDILLVYETDYVLKLRK